MRNIQNSKYAKNACGNYVYSGTENTFPGLLYLICSERNYSIDIVAGLAQSKDHESYAGSSTATGRGSHGRQVKGDDPHKKGYPGPPGWGLG
jgi:hypothetical protein